MKRRAALAGFPALKTLVVAGALAAGGCAGVPSGEIAAASASIEAAARADAHGAELQRAQMKLGLAHRWVEARDFTPARWLAEQAEVDAELASAKVATQEALRAVAAQGEAQATIRRTAFQPR